MGIAHGVLPGERAGHPPQAGKRDAEPEADRAGEHRAEHSHAGEHEGRAEPDRSQVRLGEQAVEDGRRTEGDEQDAQRHAAAAARRGVVGHLAERGER